MSRRSSPAKLEDWKRRLQRYEESNQSIAQFCLNERVSVASFFVWRKKVRAAARSVALAPLPADRTGRFQPVVIVESSSARATVIRLGSGCEERRMRDDRKQNEHAKRRVRNRLTQESRKSR